jgi:hypothetical protein
MPVDELAVTMKDKKACIVTAELDNLQPSAYAYVERLRSIGADVLYGEWRPRVILTTQ